MCSGFRLGNCALYLVLISSLAELFPTCLPAGRALLVGEQTPGTVAAGRGEMLDDGIVLVHPIAHYYLENGTRLEGRGAVPDIAVSLTHASLIEGRDLQLEAAAAALRRLHKGSRSP